MRMRTRLNLRSSGVKAATKESTKVLSAKVPKGELWTVGMIVARSKPAVSIQIWIYADGEKFLIFEDVSYRVLVGLDNNIYMGQGDTLEIIAVNSSDEDSLVDVLANGLKEISDSLSSRS